MEGGARSQPEEESVSANAWREDFGLHDIQYDYIDHDGLPDNRPAGPRFETSTRLRPRCVSLFEYSQEGVGERRVLHPHTVAWVGRNAPPITVKCEAGLQRGRAIH